MLVTPYTTHTAVFGAVLSLLREKRKIKQGVFAKKIEMSNPSISKIEKGDTPLSYENLIRCSSILGLRASAILDICEKIEDRLVERGIQVLMEAPKGDVLAKDLMHMEMFGRMLREYIKNSKLYEYVT